LQESVFVALAPPLAHRGVRWVWYHIAPVLAAQVQVGIGCFALVHLRLGVGLAKQQPVEGALHPTSVWNALGRNEIVIGPQNLSPKYCGQAQFLTVTIAFQRFGLTIHVVKWLLFMFSLTSLFVELDGKRSGWPTL
jgi:hypothetical protein